MGTTQSQYRRAFRSSGTDFVISFNVGDGFSDYSRVYKY